MKSFKQFMLEDITTLNRRGDQAIPADYPKGGVWDKNRYRSNILQPRETETRNKLIDNVKKGKINGTATVDGNDIDAIQAYDVIHGSKGITPTSGKQTTGSPSKPSVSLGSDLIDKSYADGQSNRRISSTTGNVGLSTTTGLGKYSSSLRIY